MFEQDVFLELGLGVDISMRIKPEWGPCPSIGLLNVLWLGLTILDALPRIMKSLLTLFKLYALFLLFAPSFYQVGADLTDWSLQSGKNYGIIKTL